MQETSSSTNQTHIYNNLKPTDIIMGLFSVGLIIFFVWFATINRGTPLEITSYLGMVIGVMLIILAVYTYGYDKPVLSIDSRGFQYQTFGKAPLAFNWIHIKDIEYSSKPWLDQPSTVFISVLLKSNTVKGFGLRKTLIYNDKKISAQEAVQVLTAILKQDSR